MSRYHPSPSTHWMVAKWNYDGSVRWDGVSEWDAYYPGDRLRHPRNRVTSYWDVGSARRWARRYKVPFPERPDLTFAAYRADAEARAEARRARVAARAATTPPPAPPDTPPDTSAS